MTAYIVDTHRFKVEGKYPDSSYASYDMSDNYGWEPNNRYRMFHNEESLYEYWKLSSELEERCAKSKDHTLFIKWKNS